MPIRARVGNPSSHRRRITDDSGEQEREQHRGPKHPQVKQCQLESPSTQIERLRSNDPNLKLPKTKHDPNRNTARHISLSSAFILLMAHRNLWYSGFSFSQCGKAAICCESKTGKCFGYRQKNQRGNRLPKPARYI